MKTSSLIICINKAFFISWNLQDEHVGDFKIFVKQEKKEEQGADDEVIHVTIKEEEYPPDIGIGKRWALDLKNS